MEEIPDIEQAEQLSAAIARESELIATIAQFASRGFFAASELREHLEETGVDLPKSDSGFRSFFERQRQEVMVREIAEGREVRWVTQHEGRLTLFALAEVVRRRPAEPPSPTEPSIDPEVLLASLPPLTHKGMLPEVPAEPAPLDITPCLDIVQKSGEGIKPALLVNLLAEESGLSPADIDLLITEALARGELHKRNEMGSVIYALEPKPGEVTPPVPAPAETAAESAVYMTEHELAVAAAVLNQLSEYTHGGRRETIRSLHHKLGTATLPATLKKVARILDGAGLITVAYKDGRGKARMSPSVRTLDVEIRNKWRDDPASILKQLAELDLNAK